MKSDNTNKNSILENLRKKDNPNFRHLFDLFFYL